MHKGPLWQPLLLPLVALAFCCGAFSQPSPPTPPFNLVPINSFVRLSTFRGNVSMINNAVEVFAYYPTASFDAATHVLEVVLNIAGNPVGSSVIAEGQSCTFPQLSFLDRRVNANSRGCNGVTCTFTMDTCSVKDAPFYITVEYAGSASGVVVATVTETNLQSTVLPVTDGQWTSANSTALDSLVFGPLVATAGQIVEVLVVPDSASRSSWNVRLLADQSLFPSSNCGNVLRCPSDDPRYPCLLQIFPTCMQTGGTEPPFVGNWYFRVEDRRNSGLPLGFRLLGRSYTPPAATALALDAAGTQIALNFGATAFFTVDTAAVTSGSIKINAAATGVGSDLFRFVIGDPGTSRACADQSIVSAYRMTDAAGDISACNSLQQVVPVSVSYVRADNESTPLSVTIGATKTASPTSIGIAYDVPIVDQINDVDSMLWFRLPYPTATLAEGSELAFPLTDMFDVQNSIPGAEGRLFANRGAPSDQCANSQTIRCDAAPVETCSWDQNGRFDFCSLSSGSGELYVGVEQRNTREFNFSATAYVVQPSVAEFDTNITGNLLPGQFVLYHFSSSAQAYVSLEADSNVPAGVALVEVFSPVNAQGCKRKVGSCDATNTAICALTIGCVAPPKHFIKVVNTGAAPAAYRLFLRTLPLAPITPGTAEHVLTDATFVNNDVVRRFTVPAANTPVHIRAQVTPPEQTSVRVKLENDCVELSRSPTNAALSELYATAPVAKSYVAVLEHRGGSAIANISLLVEFASPPACPTFLSVSSGLSPPLFCNGSVINTKQIALQGDTARNLDNVASLSYDFLQTVRPSSAPSTCTADTKTFVCNYQFPGCAANNAPDRSDQCREECEALVARCFANVCADDVCSRLTVCTSVPPVSSGSGTGGSSGGGSTSEIPVEGAASSSRAALFGVVIAVLAGMFVIG